MEYRWLISLAIIRSQWNFDSVQPRHMVCHLAHKSTVNKLAYEKETIFIASLGGPRGGWTRSHDSPCDQILCIGIPYETFFSQSSCLRPMKVISFESTCLVVSENPLNPLQPCGPREAMQPLPFLLEPNRHSS